ncbi:hypothetical protein D3C76_878310 [compost metagenome]
MVRIIGHIGDQRTAYTTLLIDIVAAQQFIAQPLRPIGEEGLQQFELIVFPARQNRNAARPVDPESQQGRRQRFNFALYLRWLADRAEQHDAGQAKAHQRQAMSMQRPVVQRDVCLPLTHLAQFAVGMVTDIALQSGNQCGHMKGRLFTGHRVLLQGSPCLRGIGQQDGLDVPLVLPADVQAAAQRGKIRQGNGRFQAETAPAVLTVNTGAVSERPFDGFSFLEVVQRRLQQGGLADATGAGVDAEYDRTGHLELHAEFVDAFNGAEIRLQHLTDQWFGEGLNVVLQAAQGFVQYALQTPAFLDQLLQVLAVDDPCSAVPFGHRRPQGFKGFEPCKRGIFQGTRYPVEYATVMHALVFDACGFNRLL